VMAAGVLSLNPSFTGMARSWLEPGRHKIARILIANPRGPIEFNSLKVVFSDIYGRALIPISGLQAEESQRLPKTYVLSQNEPNPFDGSTVIRYALPVDSRVELVIYNAAGQRVRTLVRGFQSAGYKSVRWDGRDSAGRKVSPGVYFYKFKAGEFEAIRKLILVK